MAAADSLDDGWVTTAPVHVIDDDGEYTDNVDEAIRRWGFEKLGLDYHMLAILGAQSGGKSTLLNLLFGTTFMMMDARHRRQCTKGIYLSHGNTERVLVFDVEGTDGRERGEQQQDFERKTSLFSFALAQVVIINIWTHDIGRYHGANLHLLRIVLELNLQLFQQGGKNKTLLLFTIRDYDEATPVDDLATTIRSDMENIWNEISKPPGTENTSFMDFFEIDYVTLPSKNLQLEKFQSSVAALKERFLNPEDPRYVWSPKFARDVPIDGLGHYLKSLWQTIKANKDLDLPMQKVMLAVHRCTQISDEAYAQFAVGRAALNDSLQASSEPLIGFGENANLLIRAAEAFYNEQAFRYETETRIKKGSELRDKLQSELMILFHEQLRRIRNQVTDIFERGIKLQFPDVPEPVANFKELIDVARNEARAYFEQGAKDSAIEDTQWNYDTVVRDVEEGFTRRIAMERENQLRKLNEFIQNKLRAQISEPIQSALLKSEDSMWSQIQARVEQCRSVLRSMLESRLQGFECAQAEIDERIRAFEARISDVVREAIADKAYERVQTLLQKRFQHIFVNNRQSLPRQWVETDNIRAEHATALEESAKLIDLHAIIRLDPAHTTLTIASNDDITGNMHNLPEGVPLIFTASQCTQLKEHLDGYARTLFIEARDAQERNRGNSQMRNFLIVLFLFFAYDDLWAYVQNPFIFMFTLLFGGASLALWYLNLMHFVLPYVQRGANEALKAGQQYASAYIPGNKPKTD